MNNFYTVTLIICTLLLVEPAGAFGEETGEMSLRYSGSQTWYLVERSNWSTYRNGTYTGLTHRENRANLSYIPGNGPERSFRGYFYVLEETIHDMTKTARAIDDTVKASFTISGSGKMTFTEDNGFPQLRGFPSYPVDPVRIGDAWQAEALRVVDPKNDGKRSILPVQAEYRLAGSEIWREMPVYRIKAKYATRITATANRKLIDGELADAKGTHDVDILVSKATGAPIMILDRLDETFFYRDGSTVRFKGNTAIFMDTPVSTDSEKLIPAITDMIAGRPAIPVQPEQQPEQQPAPAPRKTPPVIPDTVPFTVEKTDQGVRLSVRNIRFLADSDTILADEEWRLDIMADTLALAPGGRFLVEGHTASVGKTAGEKELSVRRAKKIVDELVKRGIGAESFMYAGYGGTRPVSGNDTEEGRAQNRRVEITILD